MWISCKTSVSWGELFWKINSHSYVVGSEVKSAKMWGTKMAITSMPHALAFS